MSIIDFFKKRDKETRHVIVKFKNGKYGIRRKHTSRAGFQFLDKSYKTSQRGIKDFWWGNPNHWEMFCQFNTYEDAQAHLLRFEGDELTSLENPDVGEPVVLEE